MTIKEALPIVTPRGNCFNRQKKWRAQKNPAPCAGFFNKSKFLLVFNQLEVFHKLRGVHAFAEILIAQ